MGHPVGESTYCSLVIRGEKSSRMDIKDSKLHIAGVQGSRKTTSDPKDCRGMPAYLRETSQGEDLESGRSAGDLLFDEMGESSKGSKVEGSLSMDLSSINVGTPNAGGEKDVLSPGDTDVEPITTLQPSQEVARNELVLKDNGRVQAIGWPTKKEGGTYYPIKSRFKQFFSDAKTTAGSVKLSANTRSAEIIEERRLKSIESGQVKTVDVAKTSEGALEVKKTRYVKGFLVQKPVQKVVQKSTQGLFAKRGGVSDPISSSSNSGSSSAHSPPSDPMRSSPGSTPASESCSDNSFFCVSAPQEIEKSAYQISARRVPSSGGLTNAFDRQEGKSSQSFSVSRVTSVITPDNINVVSTTVRNTSEAEVRRFDMRGSNASLNPRLINSPVSTNAGTPETASEACRQVLGGDLALALETHEGCVAGIIKGAGKDCGLAHSKNTSPNFEKKKEHGKQDIEGWKEFATDFPQLDKLNNNVNAVSIKTTAKRPSKILCKVMLFCCLMPICTFSVLASIFTTGLYVGIITTNRQPLVTLSHTTRAKPAVLTVLTKKDRQMRGFGDHFLPEKAISANLEKSSSEKPPFEIERRKLAPMSITHDTYWLLETSYRSRIDVYNPLQVDIVVTQADVDYHLAQDQNAPYLAESVADRHFLSALLGRPQMDGVGANPFLSIYRRSKEEQGKEPVVYLKNEEKGEFPQWLSEDVRSLVYEHFNVQQFMENPAQKSRSLADTNEAEKKGENAGPKADLKQTNARVGEMPLTLAPLTTTPMYVDYVVRAILPSSLVQEKDVQHYEVGTQAQGWLENSPKAHLLSRVYFEFSRLQFEMWGITLKLPRFLLPPFYLLFSASFPRRTTVSRYALPTSKPTVPLDLGENANISNLYCRTLVVENSMTK